MLKAAAETTQRQASYAKRAILATYTDDIVDRPIRSMQAWMSGTSASVSPHSNERSLRTNGEP